MIMETIGELPIPTVPKMGHGNILVVMAFWKRRE
jgi:hypothetical protein